MKRSILISIIIASIVVVAGLSVGLSIAYTPTAASELVEVNTTSVEQTDMVTVTLSCEENQTQLRAGEKHMNQRKFAFMHQVQIKNGTDGEVLYQEQYQWQHRIQNGKTFMYQYHVDGLESGMQIQLQFTYNNGKMLTYTHTV